MTSRDKPAESTNTNKPPLVHLPEGTPLPAGTTDYPLFLDRTTNYTPDHEQDTNHEPLYRLLDETTRSFSDLVYVADESSKTTVVGRGQLVQTMHPERLSLTIREIARHPETNSSEPSVLHLYVYKMEDLQKQVFRLMQGPDSQEPTGDGAIIITAATKSGKTKLLTELLKELVNRIQQKRGGTETSNPVRVITIEQGYEGPLNLGSTDNKHLWFGEGGTRNSPYPDPRELLKDGVALISRRVPADVPSVEQGLIDALRQTPDVVYLGELREPETIRFFDHFCGTGHRGAATMHAASLQEQLDSLMATIGAVGPRERERAAKRLRAVIHLTRIEEELSITTKNRGDKRLRYEAILMAMWWQTPNSVRGLAEGEPLLPHSQPEQHGCCGRHKFVTLLNDSLKSNIRACLTNENINAADPDAVITSIQNTIETRAMQQDLYDGL